jgi:poly(3-hydroxybutyrate) depolymerase
LVGFSNGGQMAAKCAIEMSDKFAAVVESAGSFALDTTFVPKRKIATLFQRGSQDYGPGNEGPSIPMRYFDTLLNTPNLPIQDVYYRSRSTHVKSFGLQNTYTKSGDTNTAVFATFKANPNNPLVEYNVAFIKGLKHAYPNGTAHPMKAAERNWEWLQQFSQ